MTSSIIYPHPVNSSESLVKRQLSFAFAGVLFGFLMGYVVAHEVYGGRYGGVPLATAPATPAMMGPRGGSATAMPEGHEGAPAATMETVTLELAALKAQIEKDPADVEALGRLGELYMDAGMYDRSVEYYRRAAEARPDDVHRHTDLGAALMMQGKPEDALDELKNAVTLDPGHAKTWYTLGFALIQTGAYQQGEEAFAKALALSPGAFEMAPIKAEIEKLKAGAAAGRNTGAGS